MGKSDVLPPKTPTNARLAFVFFGMDPTPLAEGKNDAANHSPSPVEGSSRSTTERLIELTNSFVFH